MTREEAAQLLWRLANNRDTMADSPEKQRQAADVLMDSTTTTSFYRKKLYCDACEERIVGAKHNYCAMCGRKLEGRQ